jgi:hypothetical protein
LEHVPTLFASVHVLQVSPHAVSQQTPSTQLPLTHWSAPPHIAPFAFFSVHVVPMQYALSAHWLDIVHIERQAVPTQS